MAGEAFMMAFITDENLYAVRNKEDLSPYWVFSAENGVTGDME